MVMVVVVDRNEPRYLSALIAITWVLRINQMGLPRPAGK
jgi:hypothetical protein